jgi:hypothetical protein
MYANLSDYLKTKQNYIEESIVVNGRIGTLISYRDNLTNEESKSSEVFCIDLHFKNVNYSGANFLFRSEFSNEKDKQEILSILKSIQIK